MTRPKIRSDKDDPLLTSEQAADMLQCSRHAIKRWCEAGQMTYLETPGGHLRVKTSEVRRFDLARQIKPGGLSRLGDLEIDKIAESLRLDQPDGSAELLDVIRAVKAEFARINGLMLAEE